jgi:Ca2+/Na+ antiporter
LSFIVLILIFSDLLKSKNETFLNIPLLLATIFISMPMIIFQQAKDMKLDPGLFFVSIIILYVVYKIFEKSEVKTKLFEKFLNNLETDEDKKIIETKKIENSQLINSKKIFYKIIFII